jgi:hypothetical protein
MNPPLSFADHLLTHDFRQLFLRRSTAFRVSKIIYLPHLQVKTPLNYLPDEPKLCYAINNEKEQSDS